MLSKFNKIIIIVSMSIVSSCTTGPVGGLLFTTTTFAGSVNPSNDVVVEKEATGCHHNVLGIVAWGDAGAGHIAYENKIKRIATIDHSHLSVLFLVYQEYCTIVRGS